MQKRSIIDIFGKVLNTALQPHFLIFFYFLQLDTWMNIWIFCFSSESVQPLCSRDLNQKYYKICYWFPNHLLDIDHGNTKFLYIYTTEMGKSSLWKTSRWKARLIYTTNKSNNKNDNKNQDWITKAFEKFLLREKIFIYYITKIFLLYTLNCIASFKFFYFFLI